jgi:hypothetical protein
MKRTITMVTAILLLLAAIAGAPGVAIAQQANQLEANVTPNAGPAGARFAFMAVGYEPNEAIGVWLNTPDGRAIAADVEQLHSANDDGRADWYWTAPDDAQPGHWQMVARGLDSEVERVIDFEIGSGPLPPQETNVTPKVGPPGARFAFVARGYDSNESIDVWLNTPDGRAIAADVEQLHSANDDGRADWYWTAPDDAQPGHWQMVARGSDSDVTHVIDFEIR